MITERYDAPTFCYSLACGLRGRSGGRIGGQFPQPGQFGLQLPGFLLRRRCRRPRTRPRNGLSALVPSM